MKTDCQWRMLANDFPNHKVVYNYYMRSKHKRKIQKIHDSLVRKVRISNGKNPNPTVGIIDAQSVAQLQMVTSPFMTHQKNQRKEASYNS